MPSDPGRPRKETGSWRWPFLNFGYMTALAYVGAVATYQRGSATLFEFLLSKEQVARLMSAFLQAHVEAGAYELEVAGRRVPAAAKWGSML